MADPRIYLAPASAGKTAFALALAREAAQDLKAEVRLCVSGQLQAASCRRQLAAGGGALGVRIVTFFQLYQECLAAGQMSNVTLGEAAQYRVLRTLAGEMDLAFYESLVDKPGFIQMLQKFTGDLKASRIFPDAYLRGVSGLGDEARLRELGLIYEAYQERLRQEEWADYAGLGWLAVEALEEPASDIARDWPMIIVDGFDSFTEVQLALLKALAARAGSLVVTLTGVAGDERHRRVFKRFRRTRQQLRKALGIEAQPLPVRDDSLPYFGPPKPVVLSHIEAELFGDSVKAVDGQGIVNLIEAPNRAAEAREALRWLKERLVHEGMRPFEVALLARDPAPYRPFISQTAAEFGMPVRFADGLPLSESPVIAGLLELLRLVVPLTAGGHDPALPRKGVVAAWRSPYFDWANAHPDEGASEPVAIEPADADALDAAARWGQVIGGLAQWAETLGALAGRSGEDEAGEDRDLPYGVVVGQAAQELEGKFLRFLQLITPPQGLNHYRAYVRWLEELIGHDPAAPARSEERRSLNIVGRVRQDNPSPAGTTVVDEPPADSILAELDIAALRALKDILRGLVWASGQAGGHEQVDYSTFFFELTGAIEAATYQPPISREREEILVARVLRARGLPFKAVALLGMAEGEFPTTLGEDPFLPEVDRDKLRQYPELAFDSAVESAEREFFYEAVTACSQKLLLTRPRLADSGAEWLPSPFWEEIRRLVVVEANEVKTERALPAQKAASAAELVESLVNQPDHETAQTWLQQRDPDRRRRLVRAGGIFGDRYERIATNFDGQLTDRRQAFTTHFAPGYGWSPSRLESYLACPMLFYVGRILGLEPRLEPDEGLDVRQLGNIFHAIFEALYERVDPAERNDPQKLLAMSPEVTGPILDQAPKEQGFRETAWWQQTRHEIEDTVAHSIQALSELEGRFTPLHFEARFFGQQALRVEDGGDSFRLVGVVDRVDQDPNGRIRVIDYKTAGASGYGARSLEQGERLQLPLYALAARDALHLGEPVDGFYWHIWQAQASPLTLADYGPEEAIEIAVEHAWRAVHGARQGYFVPQPPRGGCPGYCPAAAFCWHFRGRR